MPAVEQAGHGLHTELVNRRDGVHERGLHPLRVCHPCGKFDPQPDAVRVGLRRQCRLFTKSPAVVVPPRLLDARPPGWNDVESAQPSVFGIGVEAGLFWDFVGWFHGK